MEKLKKYYKRENLTEDEVLTKEDEGGGAAMGGGEVAAPAGDVGAAPTDVLAPDTLKPDGAISAPDVLGHCDHKKDGCFGPGCFHRVFPIFPIYSRLPRKKKRKHKKVTEGEDSDKINFIKYVTKLAELKFVQVNKELHEIDPEINAVYQMDYDFEPHSNWVAAYNVEAQDNVNEFPIAINLEVLYEFLYEEGLEMDDLEIDIQLTLSIWHEIGHALIQYLEDKGIFDYIMPAKKEEKVVEEYAKFHASKYTGVTSSKLQEFINLAYAMR